MFKITKANGAWLRTTSDYGQAIWWARYYVTNCEIDGTTVWAGNDGCNVVYYTY